MALNRRSWLIRSGPTRSTRIIGKKSWISKNWRNARVHNGRPVALGPGLELLGEVLEEDQERGEERGFLLEEAPEGQEAGEHERGHARRRG